MLGTYRDTELGRATPLTGALADLQRDGALDRVGLRGLGEDDVAALARAVLGDDAPARARARAHGRQRVLRRGGAARPGRDARRGARERPPCRRRPARRGSATTPTSCSPPPRCSGSSTTRARSQATAGSRRPPPRPRSTRCSARGCCGPRPPARRLEFAHALVREAVLDELNVLRRARLHRRAAEALTALGEDRHLEEIADAPVRRPRRTADARLAADALVRAGRRALEPARLRGRRRALRAARSRRSSSPDAADEAGPGAARARRRAAARRRAGRGARGVLRRRAARAPAAATPRCWPRRRSASPASASRSSISTRRRSPGSRRRWTRSSPDGGGPALAPAGPARRRALLRGRPRPLGGAQRRGRRRRRALPATPRALAAALNARHVALWRPTASRSGWPRPRR